MEPLGGGGGGAAGAPEIFAGGTGARGSVRRAVVIGNGCAGAENQCLGLLRALGLADRLTLYRAIRPTGGINKWLHFLPISLHKLIQHPRYRLDRFDLVVTPHHDYYALTTRGQREFPHLLWRWITAREPPGPNVVLTVGALHQADSSALRTAASDWHDELANSPKPLVVVNIGGPTRNCSYDVGLAKKLISSLHNVLKTCGSVRISFSRRTPHKVSDLILKEFSTHPKVYIWNGEGPNPHLGHLAWADAFVITADSISMLSEACSTGKPVYVVGTEHCRWKFSDFHNRLHERGAVRPFTGLEDMSDNRSYPPLNDAIDVAARVREVLAERGWTVG
uniref:Uncharacterized protein n=1 Tax=Oryza meridionalis TaxID=40149 RepID=A0A0E0DDX4_9ORYZ